MTTNNLGEMKDRSQSEGVKEIKKEIDHVMKTFLYWVLEEKEEKYEVFYKSLCNLQKMAEDLDIEELSSSIENLSGMISKKQSESSLKDEYIAVITKELGKIYSKSEECLKNLEKASQPFEREEHPRIQINNILRRITTELQEKRREKRVLIVEDVLFIGNIIKTKLESLGYEVDYAKDGEIALEKIVSFCPGLVMLDLMLPKVSGFEILKKIKEEPQLKAIKVIVISAKNKEKDIVTSFQLGANDFIAKPFSLDVLEEKVKILMQNN